MLEFTFYGNRYNTFGALHNCGDSLWFGANYWYSSGNAWCYEYNTKPTGILKSPVITMLKGQKMIEKLKMQTQAKDWLSGFPIGSGRIAAMVSSKKTMRRFNNESRMAVERGYRCAARSV